MAQTKCFLMQCYPSIFMRSYANPKGRILNVNLMRWFHFEWRLHFNAIWICISWQYIKLLIHSFISSIIHLVARLEKKQLKTLFIHWVPLDEHTKYISRVDFVYSNNFPFKMGQECTKVHNTSIALYKLQNVFLEGTDSRKISSLINSIKYNFIKYIKYDIPTKT